MNSKFAPPKEWFDTLKDVPEYWKGSVEDIEEVVKTIKKGKVTLGCKSAGGRNVYMIEYGERNHFNRTATYGSAASDSDNNFAYADKNRDDIKPCLMMIGGVHGAEFEGIVAILNFIHMLETGKDFKGESHPELIERVNDFHLIIIPCINPDGRARYPYNTVWGLPIETFRYFGQGSNKDGELFGHPACKQFHPIKEYSEFIGCYFNDDGVNINQDNLIPLAEETRFLIETAHEYAPDVTIDFHGACDSGASIFTSELQPEKIQAEITRFEWTLCCDFEKEGIKYIQCPKRIRTNADFFPMCLNGQLFMACGGVSMTYESNQGVSISPNHRGTQLLPYDGIYKAHLILYHHLFNFTEEIFENRRSGKRSYLYGI